MKKTIKSVQAKEFKKVFFILLFLLTFFKSSLVSSICVVSPENNPFVSLQNFSFLSYLSASKCDKQKKRKRSRKMMITCSYDRKQIKYSFHSIKHLKTSKKEKRIKKGLFRSHKRSQK